MELRVDGKGSVELGDGAMRKDQLTWGTVTGEGLMGSGMANGIRGEPKGYGLKGMVVGSQDQERVPSP